MAALSLDHTAALLPAHLRESLEGRLPDWVEAHWWDTPEVLEQLAPQAEIGWFDLHEKPAAQRAVASATGLCWLNSSYAGVDWMPLEDLARRGVAVTCGSGLTAVQVAEFALLSMLSAAKNYPTVIRAQDRREWLRPGPARRDLDGSRALIVGYGSIGQAIGQRLEGFGVVVDPVRSGDDTWRGRLGSYDWVVLALPGTPQTRGMIGAAELSAMSRGAVLVNFARADCVDQPALEAALRERRIGGAVLDITDPEPLPPEHPLWTLDNVQITMHLAGIPTAGSQARAADRFLRNCEHFRAGQPLEALVDLSRGY